MNEYSFSYRAGIPRGRVIFHVRNRGAVDHQIALVRLPDDLGVSLEEQLRGRERRPGETLAILPTFGPGEGSMFAADLRPGRYGFICFVKDPDGIPHSQKGMASEFLVPGGGEA